MGVCVAALRYVPRLVCRYCAGVWGGEKRGRDNRVQCKALPLASASYARHWTDTGTVCVIHWPNGRRVPWTSGHYHARVD